MRSRLRFLAGVLVGTLVAATVMVTTSGDGSFAATRYRELSLFTNVLRLVRDNYVEDVDESKLIRGAVRGMLAQNLSRPLVQLPGQQPTVSFQ